MNLLILENPFLVKTSIILKSRFRRLSALVKRCTLGFLNEIATPACGHAPFRYMLLIKCKIGDIGFVDTPHKSINRERLVLANETWFHRAARLPGNFILGTA